MPIKFDENAMMQKDAKFGSSGHPTYWANVVEYVEGNPVKVKADQPFNKDNSNAIYKGNKHGEGYLSELEVGLSAVWEVCVGSLTSQCDLVVNGSNQTVGVLSKKLPNFKSLDERSDKLSPVELAKEKIQLLSDIQKRELAKILVMCYSLEEDDLHRGNIGFSDGHVVKIDHDMTMYQSISSVSGNRRGYIRVNDEHRFNISAVDIKGFPVLTDADIHYWPTTYRLLEGSPGYGVSAALRRQFALLQNDPIFIEAKFNAFFEFVNTGPQEVQRRVVERLGNDKPEIASMLVNAFIARQAEMRVTLLAMPEAQKHLHTNPQCDPQNIQEDEVGFPRYKKFATPLHVALMTGCFHQIDIRKHTAHLNVENITGESPLDLAIEKRNFPAIKVLLQRGANIVRGEQISTIEKQGLMVQVREFEREQNQKQRNDYHELIKQEGVSTAAEKILAGMRDDISLNLNQKKDRAILAMQVLATSAKTPEELTVLLGLIDSDKFKFMRQLTSDFWIVRQMRGSHGVTSTYKTVLQQIQTAARAMQSNLGNKPDDQAILQAIQDRNLSMVGRLAGYFTGTKTVEVEEQKPIRAASAGIELPGLQTGIPVKKDAAPSVFKSLRESWNRSEREERQSEYLGHVVKSIESKIKNIKLNICLKLSTLDVYLRNRTLPDTERQILLLEKQRYVVGLNKLDEVHSNAKNINLDRQSGVQLNQLIELAESLSGKINSVNEMVSGITARVDNYPGYKNFCDYNVDRIRDMAGGYTLLEGDKLLAHGVQLIAATLADRHADRFNQPGPSVQP